MALLSSPGASKASDVPCLSQETGFWFVLHHVPTGPSAGMYSPGYSEHMPMGKFYNNRAHSNYRVSLHAMGTLPLEPAPSPGSSSPGLQASTACALCSAQPCTLVVSADTARALGASRHLLGFWAFRAALRSAQAAALPLCSKTLLRLLPCLCAPQTLPPGAPDGSVSNYTPHLPVLAIH